MNTPIYQLALGEEFARLTPELQEYFSLAAGSGSYGIGEGVFDVVGCRQKWLRPLLALTGERGGVLSGIRRGYPVPDRKPRPCGSLRTPGPHGPPGDLLPLGGAALPRYDQRHPERRERSKRPISGPCRPIPPNGHGPGRQRHRRRPPPGCVRSEQALLGPTAHSTAGSP